MPFQKGRAKTGGRKVGSLGIKRQLIEVFTELGYDPRESAVKIAQDENTPLELRAKIHVELIKYMEPQYRSIEHIGSQPAVNQSIAVQFVIPNDHSVASGAAIPVSAEAVQDSVRGPGRLEVMGICDQPATNGHAAPDAHPVRPRDPKLH